MWYNVLMKARRIVSSNRPRKMMASPYALGLATYEHMSAIEGVTLAPESREMIERLAASNMTAEEKRAFILKRHQKPAI